MTESEGYFENGAEHVYSMQVDVTFGSAFSFPVPFSADGTRAFYGWYSEFGGTGIQYTDPEGASLLYVYLLTSLPIRPSTSDGWKRSPIR